MDKQLKMNIVINPLDMLKRDKYGLYINADNYQYCHDSIKAFEESQKQNTTMFKKILNWIFT